MKNIFKTIIILLMIYLWFYNSNFITYSSYNKPIAPTELSQEIINSANVILDKVYEKRNDSLKYPTTDSYIWYLNRVIYALNNLKNNFTTSDLRYIVISYISSGVSNIKDSVNINNELLNSIWNIINDDNTSSWNTTSTIDNDITTTNSGSSDSIYNKYKSKKCWWIQSDWTQKYSWYDSNNNESELIQICTRPLNGWLSCNEWVWWCCQNWQVSINTNCVSQSDLWWYCYASTQCKPWLQCNNHTCYTSTSTSNQIPATSQSTITEQDFINAGFRKPTISISWNLSNDYLDRYSISYSSQWADFCQVLENWESGDINNYYWDWHWVNFWPGWLPQWFSKSSINWVISGFSILPNKKYKIICYSTNYSLYGTGWELLWRMNLWTIKDINLSINGCTASSSSNHCNNQSEIINWYLSLNWSVVNTWIATVNWNINTNKLDISKCKASFNWFNNKSSWTVSYQFSNNTYVSLECEKENWPDFLWWKNWTASQWAINWIKKWFMLSTTSIQTNTWSIFKIVTPYSNNITPWTELTVNYNTTWYNNCWFEDRLSTNSIIWWTNSNLYIVNNLNPIWTFKIKLNVTTGYLYSCTKIWWWTYQWWVSLTVWWQTSQITIGWTPANQTNIDALNNTISNNTTLLKWECPTSSHVSYINYSQLNSFKKCGWNSIYWWSLGPVYSNQPNYFVINSHLKYSYTCKSPNWWDDTKCYVQVNELAKNWMCKYMLWSSSTWIFNKSIFNENNDLCSIWTPINITKSSWTSVWWQVWSYDYKYTYKCKWIYWWKDVDCNNITIRLKN